MCCYWKQTCFQTDTMPKFAFVGEIFLQKKKKKTDFSLTRSAQKARMGKTPTPDIFFLPPPLVQFNIGKTIDERNSDSLHNERRVTRWVRARGRPASSKIFHFLVDLAILLTVHRDFLLLLFFVSSLSLFLSFEFYKNRARINRGAKVSAHHSR